MNARLKMQNPTVQVVGQLVPGAVIFSLVIERKKLMAILGDGRTSA
jgi:hypothetical protein